MSIRWACLGAGLALTILCTGCPQAGTDLLTGSPSADADLAVTSGRSSGPGGASAAPDNQTTTVAPASPASCAIPANEETWQQEVLDLVNEARTLDGLAPVAWNATLSGMASEYACDMIEYDFFDHVNPVTGETLGDRAAASGYNFRVVGENLAAGQTDPIQAFEDWMASPSHRANILDPRFVELGVGIRLGGDYGVYWVQEFGVAAESP